MKNILQMRASGQITVFASLVIVLVISVICAAIKSVSVSVAKTAADMACTLSVESVFAEYSTDLLNEFDVMYFKKTDGTEEKLKSYIEANSKYNTAFSVKQMYSLEIRDIVKATDKGGDTIKKEVLEYMKYGALSEAAQLILNSGSQVEKSQETKRIVDQIEQCEESAARIDSMVLRIIASVEGIKTNDNGLVIINGRPQETEADFVKEMCIGKPEMNNTAVNDERIFKAVETRYFNAIEILDDMKLLTEYIISDGDKESEAGGINSYDLIFERCREDLIKKINTEIMCMQRTVEIINDYKIQLEGVSDSVQLILNEIDEKRELIGGELSDGFEQDLSELKNNSGTQSVKICDVEKIYAALLNNLSVVNEAKTLLLSMDSRLTQENAEKIRIIVNKCEASISRFDNSDFIFDYTSMNFGEEGNGLGALKNVRKFLADGLLNLAISDTSKISEKQINYKDLASTLKNEAGAEEDMTEAALNNALYNEYLFMKFKSLTDSFDADGNVIETSELLDYTLEYILYGKNNDHDNLENAVVELSLIREGANLAYLFTDSEKKRESYALSLSLLGFTGNYAAIKAGQYFIMSVWAYGESLVDVRRLCSGEQVEIIKSRDTWKLSLQNLLEMNFNTADPGKEKSKGLNYEEYLRLLMFMRNETDKYFRTMDAMELKMIGKDHEDFRMKDYIYSINAVAEFKIKWLSSVYIRDINYSY